MAVAVEVRAVILEGHKLLRQDDARAEAAVAIADEDALCPGVGDAGANRQIEMTVFVEIARHDGHRVAADWNLDRRGKTAGAVAQKDRHLV